MSNWRAIKAWIKDDNGVVFESKMSSPHFVWGDGARRVAGAAEAGRLTAVGKKGGVEPVPPGG